MRRSDMVKEIASWLILSQCDHDLDLYDFRIAQEIADKLLERVETWGMIPPGYATDPECIGSYVENEWEPE